MRIKSIVSEGRQIERAITLIKLGARLQVMESETDLSYERLLRLYKEVQGESPARGMLPYSTDWFMTWQPNIHSSLFLNIYEYLNKTTAMDEIDAIIKAYELYLEQLRSQNLEPILSITRAWRLVKFVDADMVMLTPCVECGGKFVTHKFELTSDYVCGLCDPPARAGKGRGNGAGFDVPRVIARTAVTVHTNITEDAEVTKEEKVPADEETTEDAAVA